MTKFFLFLAIFGALLALYNAQPGPRVDINGVHYTSTISGWNCTISFSQKNATVHSQLVSQSNHAVSNSDLSFLKNENHAIDGVAWSGSSCNCWVLFFEGAGFDGQSLGLWTVNSTQGGYDLSTFNFQDDEDAVDEDDYKQWNTDILSYRIYCF